MKQRKLSGYMVRAMTARDPRFARVLAKLGYDVATETAPTDEAAPVVALPPVEITAAEPDDMDGLRSAYFAKVGKRPFMGWDADTLRQKIASHEATE